MATAQSTTTWSSFYRAAGIGVVPTIVLATLAVRLNRHPDALEADEGSRCSSPAGRLRLDDVARFHLAPEIRTVRSPRGQTTKRLARAGVTIGTGSDVWQILTGVHLELEEMVTAGLSPLEALHAATVAPLPVSSAPNRSWAPSR